jgi:hypothetical protein
MDTLTGRSPRTLRRAFVPAASPHVVEFSFIFQIYIIIILSIELNPFVSLDHNGD